MKARILLLILFSGIISGAMGQDTIDLTFTAVDNTAYVQIDSIKIMNRTQGGETMIYWPDTTLSLEIDQGDLLLYVGYATFSTVGISEVNDVISSFEVYQNYPNPIADRSEILMYIPHTGKVHVMITDLHGKVILRTDRQLDGGRHFFRFYPGGGNFYFLTVHWNGENQSIQMISTGQQDCNSCRLDYIGCNTGEAVLKASSVANDFILRQSGILDSPVENTSYTFQFATNIPCPGTPTVEYEGQAYNTIQIFSQCWLKENLNVGTMVMGNQNQTDNGIIEKYCYNNDQNNCILYGGLYQWWEMKQYTTRQGVQGICPQDWHLPNDEEWKVLEGAVDSQYGIGDPIWENYWGYRGYDAGTNLKAANGWNWGNGTDLYGFSGLPGGYRDRTSDFNYLGYWAGWWAPTENHTFCRYLSSYQGVGAYADYEETGYSVRCIRDY